MNNKITYHKEGDYFIANLYLAVQPDGCGEEIKC